MTKKEKTIEQLEQISNNPKYREIYFIVVRAIKLLKEDK